MSERTNSPYIRGNNLKIEKFFKTSYRPQHLTKQICGFFILLNF